LNEKLLGIKTLVDEVTYKGAKKSMMNTKNAKAEIIRLEGLA
jgi:hypothetical protein